MLVLVGGVGVLPRAACAYSIPLALALVLPGPGAEATAATSRTETEFTSTRADRTLRRSWGVFWTPETVQPCDITISLSFTNDWPAAARGDHVPLRGTFAEATARTSCRHAPRQDPIASYIPSIYTIMALGSLRTDHGQGSYLSQETDHDVHFSGEGSDMGVTAATCLAGP